MPTKKPRINVVGYEDESDATGRVNMSISIVRLKRDHRRPEKASVKFKKVPRGEPRTFRRLRPVRVANTIDADGIGMPNALRGHLQNVLDGKTIPSYVKR